MNVGVELALAVAGALVGVLLMRWLDSRNYRLEDERNSTGGPLWWLGPGVALIWVVLGHQLHAAPVVIIVACLLFAALGAALIAIDLDVHRLPDFLVLPSYPILLALLVLNAVVTGQWGHTGRAVLVGLAWFALYLVLAFVSPGASGLGLGDVKLAGVQGLLLGWFGWGTALIGVYAGFILGGIVALGLLISRRAGRKDYVAFGPPMILGAVAALLLPSDLLSRLFSG